MPSWHGFSKQLSSVSSLAEALKSVDAETPFDTLSLDGKPGATCWGSGGKRAAIFCELRDKDIDLVVSALQSQGFVTHLRTFEVRCHLAVSDGACQSIVRLLRDIDCRLEVLDLTGCEITGKVMTKPFRPRLKHDS